ncbi:MAG: type II toxin-antitoxin system VapC family toxin [Rhodopseudomonas palustris]|uniref:Ribonuclease VapC n=1 Tax=Rhodopseudomonas palustris TaxID=1076 RepID=A0A933VSS5_RHOPL|nr:type II toxin-antitoxin system VapC family toxin [Rhodopseudomonas palustris]
MIAVDTSALMAIVLEEPESEACVRAVSGGRKLVISAGTLSEALVVATRRGVAEEMERLIEGLSFEIVSVTAVTARRVAEAYQRWGKGVHPAGLNFGDCFAYDVAKQYSCRLLFIGNDFSKTDIVGEL